MPQHQENSVPPPQLKSMKSNTGNEGIVQCSPNNPTEVDVDEYTESSQVHNNQSASNKAQPQHLYQAAQQHQPSVEKAAANSSSRGTVRPPSINYSIPATHTGPQSIPIASLVVELPDPEHDDDDEQGEVAQQAQHTYQASPGTPPLPSASPLSPNAQSSNQSNDDNNTDPDHSVHPNNLIDAPVTVVISTTVSETNHHSSNSHNNSGGVDKVVGEAQPVRLADFLENRNLQRALGGFLCGAILLAILVVVSVILKQQSTNTNTTTTTQEESQAQPIIPHPTTPTVPTPTVSPTVSEPTTHPTLRPSTVAPTATPLIVEGLSQETKQALQNPRSPQSRAYAWLQGHTKLDTLEAFERRQLMGVLSIYYALDGDESFWSSDLSSPKGNWLSYDVPFCQWTPFQYNTNRGGNTADAVSSSNTAAAAASAQDDNSLMGMCNDQGQLTHLNLHNIINDSRHRGTRIPPEIGLLSHLETFEMNNCQFENNYNHLEYFLPTTLGQLTNLQELQFMGNNFKGTIPSYLPSLVPNLQYMNLDQNALHGSIPSQIGSLNQLSYLSLSWNSLDNTIPSEIGLLQTNLETLRLYKNRLVGPIPSEISSLTKLTVLELRQNDISGTLPPNLCDDKLTLLTSFGLDCHQVPCPLGCSCKCS